MRPAIYAFDHRFQPLADGVASRANYDYSLFRDRYLSAFSGLTVIARLDPPRDADRDDAPPANGPGLTFALIPSSGVGSFLVAAWRQVRSVVRAAPADAVVIAAMPTMVGVLVAAVCRLARRPYAVEVVGDVDAALRSESFGPVPAALIGRIAFGVVRWAVRHAAGAAYVTEFTLQRKYPPGGGAVTTHYSSIMLREEAFSMAPHTVATRAPGALRIVTSTSLGRRFKGAPMALEAVVELQRRGRDVHLTMVGDGELRPELERRAAEATRPGTVEFVGRVDGPAQVVPYVDRADLFVQPSLTEGLPRAVIEAMARGVAIVATRVGGTPEELLGEVGLCDPGDPVSLADAIERVTRDAAAYDAEAAANLARARNYHLDVLTTRRRRFYAALSAQVGETRRPVVAHVFGEMAVGGAELRAMQVMEQVPEVRHEYVTLSGRTGVLTPRIEAAGGAVVPMRLRSLGFPVRFVRYLRHNRVAVLHSNVATFSGLLLLLGRLAGVPQRIAHFRTDADGRADSRPRRWQRAAMRTLISACATDIVGVTPTSLDFALGGRRSDSRGRILPNGLDAARLRSLAAQPPAGGVTPVLETIARWHAEGALVVVHVGRSLLSKRRARAVEIVTAPAAAGERPVRLLLVGAVSDAEAGELDRLAAVRGAGGIVIRTGRLDPVAAVVAATDVLLLTSTREGMPGVVLEALAVGTPVVASRLPGVEYVAARVGGVTVVDPAAPDAVWVRAVREAGAASPADRAAIRASFDAGPFQDSTMVDAYRALWHLDDVEGAAAATREGAVQ